ncbi:MAG: hypothetical protein AAFR96_09800 [Planctomycetota bacterium]
MTGGALPLWAVAPPAAVLMVLLAGYVLALREADVPESRRRIRTAATMVMIVLQPLLVYLFAIGGSHQPRPFVFTWALVMGLLALLVVLAMLDAINNAKLSAANRAELREELRAMREEIRRISDEASAEGGASADSGAARRAAPLRLVEADEPDRAASPDHQPKRDGTRDA